MKKKRLITRGTFVLVSLFFVPSLSLAASVPLENQQMTGALELRASFKLKQFFKEHPPKKYQGLSLVTAQKTVNGYFGYYN